MGLQVQRHERFYFDDGNVVFRVEDTLFNVHRYFFKRDSLVFRDMLSSPSAVPGEGLSETDPIVLEGVRSADFANLLSCFYPSTLRKGELSDFAALNLVLDLALKWEFDTVRDFIAQEIERKCGLAEQITTARRLGMRDWCWAACEKMCCRRGPVTLEEAEILGIVDTVRIARVRERLRGQPCGEWNFEGPSPYAWLCYGDPLELRPKLGIDLERAKSELAVPTTDHESG
ncbi:hypothetical protein FOMPIDRAFT_1118244 [Fomitopsis schrenkii]|uniref:BTB domain-containing protein n=1 Tax=Fomitopsis schrenkii TaxID=2126942 RepID=S8FM61_FOMSC|nr:hypothetical protein FOMPIDRAFT_1118244 [Fomitopsis schrenkii]